MGKEKDATLFVPSDFEGHHDANLREISAFRYDAAAAVNKEAGPMTTTEREAWKAMSRGLAELIPRLAHVPGVADPGLTIQRSMELLAAALVEQAVMARHYAAIMRRQMRDFEESRGTKGKE